MNNGRYEMRTFCNRKRGISGKKKKKYYEHETNSKNKNILRQTQIHLRIINVEHGKR
jgi:hypothetical protein